MTFNEMKYAFICKVKLGFGSPLYHLTPNWNSCRPTARLINIKNLGYGISICEVLIFDRLYIYIYIISKICP